MCISHCHGPENNYQHQQIDEYLIPLAPCSVSCYFGQIQHDLQSQAYTPFHSQKIMIIVHTQYQTTIMRLVSLVQCDMERERGTERERERLTEVITKS